MTKISLSLHLIYLNKQTFRLFGLLNISKNFISSLLTLKSIVLYPYHDLDCCNLRESAMKIL